MNEQEYINMVNELDKYDLKPLFINCYYNNIKDLYYVWKEMWKYLFKNYDETEVNNSLNILIDNNCDFRNTYEIRKYFKQKYQVFFQEETIITMLKPAFI